MPKEALVVKREILFKDKYFQGFMAKKEFDYLPIILKNYSYHERGDLLENDQTLQQIIPYILIVNTKEKKILAYKRANNDNYSEKRLRNKWSIGIGGHIERKDDKNPIDGGMMRELMEEVSMKNYSVPEIIGFIKDDKGDVEKVHFGVAALLETVEEVTKGDDEMVHCAFYGVDEFETLLKNPENELEGWSKIAWPVIKEYLSK